MWDDAVIGDGDRVCSATKIFDLGCKSDISSNSVSYWISDVFLDLGITIYKDTPEGIKLTEMIKSKADGKEIDEFLRSCLLKHISVDKLMDAIHEYGEKCRREGADSLAAQLRSLLQVHNY